MRNKELGSLLCSESLLNEVEKTFCFRERSGFGSRRGAEKCKIFCADLRKSAGEKRVSRGFLQMIADKCD